jgi:hypothetical protein
MRLLLLTLLALVLVPAASSAGPRTQTISGTISANSGNSITVTSADRSVTCAIRGEKAQTALARWGVGARAAMACKRDRDGLVLTRLSRLDSKDPKTDQPATGTTNDGDSSSRTGGTTTSPAPTPTRPTTTTAPTPAPPTTDRRYANGLVTALSSDSVTVNPDEGGDSLRCRITPASDSASAAAKLTLGAHVGIVCRRDGDSWVLAGSTSV